MRASEQLDTTIRIVTPENIAFTYQVAGPFRRLPAFAIDMAIRMGFWLLVGILLFFSGAMANSFFRELIEALGTGVMLLLWFFLEWFYGGVFETYWNGQTPGKRLLGIRVLSTSGQPVNGLQAMMRNILRSADMMPIVPLSAFIEEAAVFGIPTGMLGLICFASTHRFQRLGDLVGGTMVVVEDRSWMVGVQKLNEHGLVELAEQIPPSFQVSREVSRALATYVERRKAFSVPRREEIAKRLADPLIERFRLPPNTSADLLVCALYHRTFISDRATAELPSDAPGMLELAGVKSEAPLTLEDAPPVSQQPGSPPEPPPEVSL